MTLAARPADLARAFPWAPPLEQAWPERYNLAPTQNLLALAESGWRLLRWGLVPHWAHSPREVGGRYINARVETLAEKAPFRECYQARRCLVPTSGFYEWRREGKARTPFLVFSPDSPLLALAGIWAGWGAPEERLYSLCVLTRPAAGAVAQLHDRMPVVLPAGCQQRWLQESIPTDELASWEVPLRLQEVSSYVNNVKNEGPVCIKPMEERS